MPSLGFVETARDTIDRRPHGNNHDPVTGERKPSVAFVAQGASVTITENGMNIQAATDIIRDQHGQPVPAAPWWTDAIDPRGNAISYVLVNGRSVDVMRPLWRAVPGTYQADRIQKAIALGFLLPECGCIQDQLARRRLGIVTIRPSKLVAKELLDGRAPCEGECKCFAIEARARRAIHEAHERERAAEARAQNPQAKTDDAIKLLAESVTALMQDAKPKAKRRE